MYHIRRVANLLVKYYSLIIVQVFTPGHVSSGKRCKCSSAHSAAFPKEELQRSATSFDMLHNSPSLFSWSERGEPNHISCIPGALQVHRDLQRAVVFTFLLQHTDGKLSRYGPDSQMT